MKVAITTLGCKANQYDSFAIEGMLMDNYRVVPFSEPADAYIINTCTVTNIADYKSRYLIRKAKKSNPDAVVIVTGCYAQVSPDDVKRIGGIDYILGNVDKDTILNLIYRGKQEVPQIIVNSLESSALNLKPNLIAKGSSDRTRAFLKIQDGCNRRCSYCIIPYARGKSRSLSFDDMIREIELLIQNNYKEIVLTGIHLGSYGTADREGSLAKLIKEIDKRNYPCRFRISSLDPDEVTDELIEIMALSNGICNHLHLAVQSCDDSILQRMNRHHYSKDLFFEKVKKIHDAIDDISIGIDIIAGFPGETDRQFMNTYKSLEDLPLTYFHIFPFSKRKGTPAHDFKDEVDFRLKEERCILLKNLGQEKRQNFYKTQIGKGACVLVESIVGKDSEMVKGKSRNYIPVVFKYGTGIINKEVNVLLKESKGKEVFGVYDVRC
ncbi:MAG: tRNA (N(6)-L-threonylcarbamoyladenosine(37)-C(2))-methylthiotransferase MtaB [Deltaproteobacteria bacterium]|nr:tRNA (N(6)-L-threonylcarbamoyladenosine(37)-C(2))-methylthiotransferase MtaB [Deltaproteobacteria bacterium]